VARDEEVVVSALLAGTTVLVTGAARGLGAAIAGTCVGHGARVVLTDVLERELALTTAALGDAATAHVLDVADPAAWDALAEELSGTIGRPDALVNNAGIVRAASLLDTELEDLRRTLDVNVGGTFLGMRTFLRLHVRSGTTRPGSIVNISSVRGLIGAPRTVTYAASKFGSRGLTKAAAVELGRFGIRVNAVCPGPIESDMSVGNEQFAGLDWDGYVAQLPLARMGRPVDVGEAVAWLASDASSFITGVDLPVDGGLTATSYSVVDPRDAAAVVDNSS
jgi:3alpha(or 20beta)-hydroxysteroid dehydrogenase